MGGEPKVTTFYLFPLFSLLKTPLNTPLIAVCTIHFDMITYPADPPKRNLTGFGMVAGGPLCFEEADILVQTDLDLPVVVAVRLGSKGEESETVHQ